jgi:hypothetical protein
LLNALSSCDLVVLTPQLLPNWIITYLLAILLTLMGLRLYTKGKQTYAKETQLLLAAKAAAKERRLDRQRTLSITRGRNSSTAQHGAARAGHGASASGVAVPTSNKSRILQRGNSALSRSMSRLRGSLVVAVPPGSSLPSPSGIVSPAGSTLVSPAARLIQAADGGVAGGIRRSIDQTEQGKTVEKYVRSILFQVRIQEGCWYLQWRCDCCCAQVPEPVAQRLRLLLRSLGPTQTMC